MKKLLLLVFSLVTCNLLMAQCVLAEVAGGGGIVMNSIVPDPSGDSDNYDADGDGNFESDDEYVEICNTSAMTIDIGGWQLGDNDNTNPLWEDFTFPSLTELGAGDCIFVVSGWDGTVPQPSNVFAVHGDGNATFISNDGDPIFLYDPTNDEYCALAYGDVDCTNIGATFDGPGTAMQLGCDDLGNISFQTGCALNNTGTGGQVICGLAPLPVDFISFKAQLTKESMIALTWFTASEENNSHFEIEHSMNGRDFEAIGKVDGRGTSSVKQQYNYIHENAAIGKNYYRLRQVDFDDAFEYSPVAVVKVKGEDRVQIRPTLADQRVSLVFEEAIRQEAQLQVFDVAGRQISAALVSPGTEQFELPVADFTKGMYFIQLALNGDVSTLKFIKR